MAVQQNKKSPSKRGMHRSHDHLGKPPVAVEPTTGETHLLPPHPAVGLLPRQEGHPVQGLIDANAAPSPLRPYSMTNRHRRRRRDGRGPRAGWSRCPLAWTSLDAAPGNSSCCWSAPRSRCAASSPRRACAGGARTSRSLVGCRGRGDGRGSRSAIRTKKQSSSMRIAIDLVKSGRAQACVSAGNTGALMGNSEVRAEDASSASTAPRSARCCPRAPAARLTCLDLGANADCAPRAPAAVRASWARRW